MIAVAAAGLTHRFGRREALRDVSFEIAAGSFNVVLGPNGAGKTTLISLLTGLYHARAGSVEIFGHSLRSQPTRALRCLGVVFQHSTLDLDLGLGENLRYQASLYGLSAARARERGKAELERIGIADRAGEAARQLSGGLRRRAEIAAALLHRPRLLILDEATVGLDVASRRFILGHIRNLCRSDGLTVLWTTHLLDEIEPGDTLLLLHDGMLRWSGAPDGLLAAARQPTLADAFLAVTGARAAA
jgi:ABC-2 type transport system ATP-binding protein